MSPQSPAGTAAPGVTRRDFLERWGTLSAATAAAASGLGVKTAGGQNVPTVAPVESDEDVDKLIPKLSNWGRWGREDQLGTLNFISAETKLRAVSLIRKGRVVSLAREISTRTPNMRQLKYEMHRYQDPLPEEAGSIDFIGMIYHGFAVTHLDALCHVFTPEGKDGMYNGYPISDVTPEGALNLGIEHVGKEGIVGRGVLLDIAALKGAALPLGTAIRAAELDAAERAARVRVGEGDILFVRNGAGAANTYRHGSGLHPDCLPWLHERRVSVLSNDSDGDPHPSIPPFRKWTEPMHMVALPYMGLSLLDQVELDALAAACREEGRSEFFVTAAPWRFRGATSSPMNPLAIF